MAYRPVQSGPAKKKWAAVLQPNGDTNDEQHRRHDKEPKRRDDNV